MSVAMDRALMTLSLEEKEEDIPFTMPDLPGSVQPKKRS